MSKKLAMLSLPLLALILLTAVFVLPTAAQQDQPTAETATVEKAELEAPAAPEAGVEYVPPGWAVVDNAGTGSMWNTNDTFGVGNRITYGGTGASGLSMAAEAYGSGIDWDTEIWSPPIDLTGAITATVEFESNFQDYVGNGDAYLDVSTDGGGSWTNIHAQSADDPTGGELEVFSLDAYVGNTVHLRWWYTATSTTAWYWHIDNVHVYDAGTTYLYEDFEPPPYPDLSGSWKMAPPKITVGEPITYRIVISNSGDAPALGAVMTDVIPMGTTYIPGSLFCPIGSCSEDGTAVYWNGDLPPNAATFVEFGVDVVDPMCGYMISNTATITAPLTPGWVQVEAWTEVWDVVWLHEEFEGSTFPPLGWTVNDYNGSGVPGSVFTNTNPGGRANLTGGSGNFVVADSDEAGSGVTIETDLWLPPLDIPACTDTYLIFKTDYNNINSNEIAAVQASTDGGTTWDTLLLWNFDVRGPHTEMVDLSPYAGMSNVILRFYYNDGGAWAWWWEIDDVQVVSCLRQGLVLEPDYQSAEICPSGVMTYPMRLENCSPTTDTFDLMSFGNMWPAWVEPYSVTLGFGESADLMAYHQVPCGATGADVATILADGQTTGLTDTAFIETFATTGLAWYTMAPLPAGRVFHAAVGTDQYYYVIGGTSDAGGTIPVSTTYRYDIGSDSWTEMAPMPVALDSINAAAVGDMIYVPGGAADDNTYVYDTVADSWSTIAANGTFTWATQYATAVSGTIVYRLGGLVDDGAGGFASTDRVWALDTVSEIWTELPPMQQDRTSFAAASIEGNLYVAGGVHFPGFAPEMTSEAYTSTWGYVAPVPDGGGAFTRWSYNADATFDDKLWLMAGRRDAGWAVLDHTGYYDPATDSWTTTPDLPILNQGRVYLQGGVAGGEVFATGGRDSAGATIYDTHEWLGPACPEVTPELEVTAPPFEAALCPDDLAGIDFELCSLGVCGTDWGTIEISPTFQLAGAMSFVPAGEPSDAPIPDLAVTSVGPATQGAPAPAAPDPEAVLWDQPLSAANQGAYANQDFEPVNDPFDIFIADDFSNPEFWAIDTIFVPANTWNVGCDLTCADMLHWQVYPDAGGVPAGDPWSGGAIFDLTLPPDDPMVSLGTGVGGFQTNVTLTLDIPFYAPPGDWWFVFYPSMNYGACACQSGRHVADTNNGYTATVINPGGGFFSGQATSWTPITDPATWDMAQSDMAFRLEGETLPDVPWLSVVPPAGHLDPGTCFTPTVVMDAGGMMPGDYFADLLLLSEDPDMPIVSMPVTMTVWSPAGILAVSTVITDLTVAFDATVAGTEPITYAWDFGDGVGTSNLEDPVYTYDAGGCYTVTLAAGNLCRVETIEFELCLCQPVEDVALTLLTGGTIYTDTLVEFEGDVIPDDATKPYTYTVAYGDGSAPVVGTSSDDPFEFNYTYANTGTYTAQFWAWNCDMTTPMTDSVTFTVYVVGECAEVSGVDLTLETTGTIYAGDQVDFSGDVMPDDATKPYTYTVAYGDGSTPVVGTSSDDPFEFNYTYANTGTYTAQFWAWNCDMTTPMTDSVTFTVYAMGECIEVTGVDLTQVTTGTIYAGDTVDFSANISPDDATKPYTYALYLDGTLVMPAGTSSDDPYTFDHTFDSAGSYSLEFWAWNCDMTTPFTDTLEVTVMPVEEGYMVYLPIVIKND